MTTRIINVKLLPKNDDETDDGNVVWNVERIESIDSG
jgi:hypothetical protein